jgi:carbon storage regulator
MLFLKRKPGESILIGHDIEIKIHDIKGKYVNLAISFPKGVSVLRREVYDRIQEENQKAADSGHLFDIIKKKS